jgi:hypothetical protein
MIALLIVDLALHYQRLDIQYQSLAETFRPSAVADSVLSHTTSPARFLSMTRAGEWYGAYFAPAKGSTLLSGNAGAVYGLEDLQGYNPLQLSRYQEFLSGVNNRVHDDYHFSFVRNPLSPLLQYLNLRFLVTDPSVPLTTQLVGPTELNSGRTAAVLHISTRPLRGLVVDSALGNSTNVPQGTAVAQLVVVGSDGASTPFTLRAGVETAEWAHDRPDARQSIQHDRPAAIARNLPGGPDFQGHVYRAMFSFSQPTAISELRLELLAPQVSWIVDQVTSDADSWRDSYQSVYEGNGVRILQAEEVLPRAYLTHTVEQTQDATTILARLQDPNFDPRQSVILEEAPYGTDAGFGPPLTSDGRWISSSTTDAPSETADMQARDPNRLTIHVSAQRPAMLVLSETFYPAWRAYVDGHPAHVYRANYLFRAVAVPSGEHQVEMRYESAAFQVGLIISAATLIVVLVAGGCFWVYTRRRSASGT